MMNKELAILLHLAKHRLSLMVTVSAAVGYILAQRGISIDLLFLSIGVFFMAGGTSALNQWQEWKNDSAMNRTKNRPIPSGKVSKKQALFISIAMMCAGAIVLLLGNNIITCLLGLSNIVFYNFLYTPLKKKTVFAVLPGSIVGAVPPLMGWAATGSYIWHPSILLYAFFIFLWQVPHFWLLIIHYGKEYENAGFSSMSEKFNPEQIKRMIFTWTAITSAYLLSFPYFDVITNMTIVVLLVILNSTFILMFYRTLFKSEAKLVARKSFMLINYFMTGVMLILVLNSIVS